MEDNGRHIVRVYVGALSQEYEALSVEASKHTTADEIVTCIVQKLGFPNPSEYELAEVVGNSVGQECKERRLSPFESPVALKLLWPKSSESADSVLSCSSSGAPSRTRTTSTSSSSSTSSCPDQYRFCLREKLTDSLWSESFVMDPQIIRDYFYRFLYQPKDKEYPDLCQLPDLNEDTLLENLKSRFNGSHIYTYVGSILIAVNPFKFHPIYNPKYVKLYQNRRREELPPHIFAIADSAYHTMLKEKRNQCIVISGESGSGKTESTNFLLHHLTALSQKGTHGSGVEQTILSAGPVLEAFGNAKTAHNNNSSRFGKFIQVSYRENGMVHGAIVQKYLLEKSRICCQAKNERNYHVFYYLLAGASESERNSLALLPPHKYHYLNRSGCYTLDGVDESYEFSRLKQSMEMVGFGTDKQRKLFCVLSAVLLLGNVEFLPKKSSYHHDESVLVKNSDVVRQISSLLRVTEETLTAALTSKRARVSGEMLVINYRMPEAIAARDAMAKCLYGALFDWIVLQVNHALLSKKDPMGIEATGKSIGVLDIFGFEDFGNCNSFEQYCINYANEHLQNYFNQHVFKYEQEEYKKEGIRWTNIGFMDNTPCLSLIEAKPNGLICILDDQCNFPGATNETLLQKFNSVHKEHEFYEVPQRREPAFIIRHYAGKVKYQVMEFREKNMDLMRHDIVSVLKNSSLAFVRELVGIDPVAVFRWAILRAFFRAYFAFHEAGHRYRLAKAKSLNRTFSSPGRRRSSNNDHLLNDLENLHIAELNNVNNQSHLPVSRSGFPTENNTNYYAKYKPIRRTNNRSNYSYYHNHQYPSPNGYSPNSVNGNGNHILASPENVEALNHSRLNGGSSSNHENGHSHSQHDHSKALDCQCCYPSPASTDYGSYYVKNRSFRSQPLVTRGMKNLQSVKTLASHTASMGVSNKHYNPRKQPISVSQQFQQSLHSLMVTLNQANPFFIRCIKSNSDKSPNNFDDDIVQRQLRYTGMLETVRIRQAGYNVRLTFDEFVNIYRILLPNGLDSTRGDVEEFLASLTLNRSNYQLGETKIFLREVEKVKLDYYLHQQIMSSIVAIQRWYRTVLERRQFLHVREAIIRLQAYVRMFLAQRLVANLRMRHLAATYIQKMWRGYRVRKWYESFRSNCVQFQARVKGSLVRQRYQHVLEQQRKLSKQRDKLQTVLRLKGDGDSHSGQSTDEAFLSKGSSQEELDELKSAIMAEIGDSDGSSGVHEDSEGEILSSALPALPPRAPKVSQGVPPLPALSESMTALTLALTSTPFSLARHSGPGHSQITHSSSGGAVNRNSSPSAKERNSSHNSSNKKKLSLKLRKGAKDEHSGRHQDEEDLGSYAGEKDENGHSRNPFHRAKKHIKTLISGNKTKLDKHEAVLLDSESETEDTDTLTLNSNSNSSSTPSTLTLDQCPAESLTKTSAYKDQFINNNNSRLSLDSKLKTESETFSQETRPARSLQFPFASSSASIPEHDFHASGVSSETAGFQQRFHRKIAREESGGGGRALARSRQDRREERKRLIAERSEEPRSSVGSVEDSLDRRGSEDFNLPDDADFRRGSRDSNQSYPSGAASPSHSSQDSLFSLHKANGLASAANMLTQSLSYGYAPMSGVSVSQSALLGSTTHQHRRVQIREDAIKDKDASSSTPDFSARDVRRTRSVSETRPESSKHYPSTTSFASTEGSSEEILGAGMGKKSALAHHHGHVLDKVTKFHRGDTCCICRKNMHILFAPGLKCFLCRFYFHTRCLHAGISSRPCPNAESATAVDGGCAGAESAQVIGVETSPSSHHKSSRRKYRKPSKNSGDMSKPGKFSLTGTSEFTDRTDQIISGVRELEAMQQFISKKIYQVRQKEGEKVSAVDRVFQQALREFKESLVSTFSVASKQGQMPLNIKYKDLIANFANIMETVSKHEGTGNDFPTTMGVNAFRGFLNEFMNENRVDEKPKPSKGRKERRKEKGSKRQKTDDSFSHLGHSFVSMVINIPTACEICSSFIMWPIERGVVCQKCKLACHKKCHLKVLSECIEGHGRSNSTAGSDCGIFGAPLRSLVEEDGAVPLIVDQLVTAIELYGLRQEGIYRKSGVSSRVRELKQEIEDGKDIDHGSMYPVHVLTSVLKSFFRELPEPLLTFELYDEFLRAADLSQPEDRVHTIFAILKKLPKQNYDLMERLVFHLVRVALYEEKNRMNANSLAIVFAPCILRTNKTRQVQESLSDISRQTMCIETIISEQLKKVKATLNNIESVDSATHSFSVRLNSIRSSKMRSPPERKKASSGSTGSLSDKSMNESTTPESMSAEEEEEYLTRHLKHLEDEKAMLTSVLPSLSRTPSDDDMLSTDPEVDSPGGSVDDLNLHHLQGRTPSPRQTRAQSLQYSKSESLVVSAFTNSRLSPTLRLPATSPLLHNIVKNRGPLRKPPSRFVRNLAVVDFGEGENEDEEDEHFEGEDDEEDDSVHSVDQNNEEDAIMV